MKHDPNRVAVRALARECGSYHEDVARWLKEGGIDIKAIKTEDIPRCMEIIRSHKDGTAERQGGGKGHRNKEGLTYLEAVQKEDSRRKKRENDIAEKVLADEWMEAAAHHSILSNLVAKLEAIPDKAKTELGLTQNQRDRLQKIIDECRADAASETERAFTDAHKKVMEKTE